MKRATRTYLITPARSYDLPGNGSLSRRGFKRPKRADYLMLQPVKYPFARIDNVLGDFSEQTGASFG